MYGHLLLCIFFLIISQRIDLAGLQWDDPDAQKETSMKNEIIFIVTLRVGLSYGAGWICGGESCRGQMQIFHSWQMGKVQTLHTLCVLQVKNLQNRNIHRVQRIWSLEVMQNMYWFEVKSQWEVVKKLYWKLFIS